MEAVNRRAFLSAFLGAAVLDPEILLWVPGKKLISIPNDMEVRQVLSGCYTFREVEILPEWREQWLLSSHAKDWYYGKVKLSEQRNDRLC